MADSNRLNNLGPPTAAELQRVVDMLDQHLINSAQVRELEDRAAGIERVAALDVDEAEARTQAAIEVDKLITSLTQFQGSTARNLAHADPAVQSAFRGVDLAKVAAGLRVVATWLRAPTPETTAVFLQFVEQLRTISGGSPNAMTEATEKQLEAEIDADVAKSLDDIFGGKKWM